MRFELFVALRYLLAPRRQARVSLVSMFSTIGVAVGVMALIIALALMTGLQGELRAKLLGAVAHIYLSKAAGFADYRADVAAVRKVPGVVGAGPAILGKAIVVHQPRRRLHHGEGDRPGARGRRDRHPERDAEGPDPGSDPADGRRRDRRAARHPARAGSGRAARRVGGGHRHRFSRRKGRSRRSACSRGRSWCAWPASTRLGLLEFDSAYGLVSLEFGEHLLSTGRAGPDPDPRRRPLRGAGHRPGRSSARSAPATPRATGPA